MELEGIDHVALAVRDVEQSANWYVDVLGFERRYDQNLPRAPAGSACFISLFAPLAKIFSPRRRN